MKKLFAVLMLSVCAFAQGEQRVIELKNATNDYGRLAAFVEAFGVGIKPSPNDRFIVLRGTKEQLDAVEAAIKKIDVPQRNIDVTFQIVSANTTAGADKLTRDLDPVVAQLKKSFLYQSFQLVDSIQLRTRDGQRAEASSVVQTSEGGTQISHYNVKFTPALASDDKGTIVKLNGLQFGAQVPIVQAPAAGVAAAVNQVQYANTGINQNVDVREGQKVVVGRANLNGKDGAFFLVVTAKVVD